MLVISPVSDGLKIRLAAQFDVHESLSAEGRADLLARIGSRVRVILGWHPIDDAMLDACPGAGLIATYATGFDNVDLDRARAEGRAVVNAPGLNRRAVAEMALLLTLAGLRRLPMLDRFVRSGDWSAGAPVPPPVQGLSEAAVGVAGAGGIGGEILRVFAPLAGSLHYFARAPRDVPGQWHGDLAAMARACDVLILALPGGARTRGIANGAVIAALRPQGVLVNLGRASTLDHDALCQALAAGHLGLAALDVFDAEPEVPDRLRQLGNTILTPHFSGATRAARAAKEDMLMELLACYLRGAPLSNRVA